MRFESFAWINNDKYVIARVGLTREFDGVVGLVVIC
jgi:hypothetical protein